MYLDYTPHEKALRAELRAYFERLMTAELEQEIAETESGGPLYTRALRQMGRDGWLGIGWPRRYGGQERPPIEQFIFFDEVQRAGYPIPLLTLNTVGPTLIEHGSDAQRDRFLPKILSGELHFSIGYTEPQAGTDLAALKTTAVRDGDHYVINGQKAFTSLAEHADYIWLAARTDPAAPKHKGISILIVDRSLPGIKLVPVQTLGDNRVSSTFFDDVRVPVSMRVGAENQGWKLITTQLNHERVALACSGKAEAHLEDVVEWARTTDAPEGGRVIDRPWVQLTLARCRARLEALRLLNWRLAWELTQNDLNAADASTVKVYGTELFVEVYRAFMEVLGEAGVLKNGSRDAFLAGRIEQMYRWAYVVTFGGGVNEIQREIIATAGLGMPRTGR